MVCPRVPSGFSERMTTLRVMLPMCGSNCSAPSGVRAPLWANCSGALNVTRLPSMDDTRSRSI
jgi:hypothetical protein